LRVSSFISKDFNHGALVPLAALVALEQLGREPAVAVLRHAELQRADRGDQGAWGVPRPVAKTRRRPLALLGPSASVISAPSISCSTTCTSGRKGSRHPRPAAPSHPQAVPYPRVWSWCASSDGHRHHPHNQDPYACRLCRTLCTQEERSERRDGELCGGRYGGNVQCSERSCARVTG
jgi:hypothetical protein